VVVSDGDCKQNSKPKQVENVAQMVTLQTLVASVSESTSSGGSDQSTVLLLHVRELQAQLRAQYYVSFK
jgi:hypothetical protein